ncbi:MAG TPA: PQQ-dependent sugar dehydrogenase, partial [Solirubrobacterales bacterium]|nr:PQQ-dependent sugar dehydrogenase [Solirubrobacterales bacterium]
VIRVSYFALIRAGKFILALLLMAGLWSGSAQALSLQQVGSGFEEPIYVTSDPSNPDRLFVVERPGSILLVENGAVKPFTDIRSLVDPSGEGGLLSIALSPDFQTSGRFFVYYTGEEQSPPEIHLAEMVAVGSTASPATRRNLLTIPHPDHNNHYGGQLQFGPEGNLFISTGDGGGSNDEHQNAQNLATALGKILRIHPDPSGALPYTIPAGNPFAASPGADPTIWSYGLRNPFRFSFDHLTGDLWIGDVGQDEREEVDFAAAPWLGGGANYGWNCREGFLSGTVPPEPGCASATSFVDPVFDYVNPPDSCAAVIGGYVARGPGYGDLFGRYLYGDLCAGDLRSFWPGAPFATDRDEGINIGSLNSFGEDSCGRLYAVSGNGPVYRLVGPGGTFCPSAAPAPVLAPSFVGIRAITKRVLRKRRALISAWVSPCKGRRGERVTLWRGRRKMGVRRLDRVCSARFRPRIKRRTGFRVTVKANQTHAAAISRKLTIKIKRRKPASRRAGNR